MNEHFKKIVLYMRSLPKDHPDRGKFCLEQACIRMNIKFNSHLVDLQDPDWEEKVKIPDDGRMNLNLNKKKL